MGNQARIGAFGERSHDTPDLPFAEDVSHRLALGEAVPAADVMRAGMAFVDRLRADARGEGQVRGELATLLDRTRDPAARAGLVGVLIAAPRAERLLNWLTSPQGRAALSGIFEPAEVDTLPKLLLLPPAERLAKLTDMLAEESGKDGHDHPMPPGDERRRDRAVLPERHVAPAKSTTAIPTGGPDPPRGLDGDGENGGRDAVADPAARLRDMSQPEEARVREALRLGRAAIPSLVHLAQDPAHREVAAAALLALGNDPAVERDVRKSAIQMEHDLDTRKLGEFLRRTIEGTSMDGPDGRQLSRRAEVDEGWLNRALNNCDPPSILMAGAGREAIAIPMLVRRLTELRSRPVARTGAPTSGRAATGV